LTNINIRNPIMPLFLRFVKKSMMVMLPENGSGLERIMKKRKMRGAQVVISGRIKDYLLYGLRQPTLSTRMFMGMPVRVVKQVREARRHST